MNSKSHYIIKKIIIFSKIRKSIIISCFVFLVFGLSYFVFYFSQDLNKTIKYIARKENINGEKIEKIMTNPKVKFEYNKNEFYDIEASKAVHKNNEDILLTDVLVKGRIGDIKSGKLLITNEGNSLHFSENPILTFKQTK